ncbi:hypothetical protein NMY22_g18704 [Coprinellus aureogranulatus]|nr:hypothetical protein NMY22_g18704 [Coprinellus aureogranulatus]
MPDFRTGPDCLGRFFLFRHHHHPSSIGFCVAPTRLKRPRAGCFTIVLPLRAPELAFPLLRIYSGRTSSPRPSLPWISLPIALYLAGWSTKQDSTPTSVPPHERKEGFGATPVLSVASTSTSTPHFITPSFSPHSSRLRCLTHEPPLRRSDTPFPDASTSHSPFDALYHYGGTSDTTFDLCNNLSAMYNRLLPPSNSFTKYCALPSFCPYHLAIPSSPIRFRCLSVVLPHSITSSALPLQCSPRLQANAKANPRSADDFPDGVKNRVRFQYKVLPRAQAD